MITAHFECIGGVAGDMTLAALIDAGCPAELIQALPDRLGLTGVSVTVERVKVSGIDATHVKVLIDDHAGHKHRHLPHIIKIIDAADLPPRTADNARRVFQRLAQAEAAVHGTTVDKVHFHEVGANDAIIDIVGACLALEHLKVRRVTCSPIPTGHGTVRCEHGVMPVPAPATAQLLRGVPLDPVDQQGELTTPTGAALMTTLAEQFGPAPAMRIDSAGYGAGTARWEARPNLLRVLLGPASDNSGGDAFETDTVAIIESQLDDATGQQLADALERVLDAGALDAYLTPITMKKGRPGQLVTVVCRPEEADGLAGMLLRLTNTLGVRRTWATRSKLARRHEMVETRYGRVRIKVAETTTGHLAHGWPEHDDAAEAARRHDVSLGEVEQEALRTWRNARNDAGSGD